MIPVTLSGWLRDASYRSKWAGVRWTLLFSFLGFWLLSTWLRTEYGSDDSTLWLVMRLFLLLLQWTLVGILGISVLSGLAAWLYFRHQVKGKRVRVQVGFGDGQKAEAGLVPISILVEGQVFRPFFGTIQAHLLFGGRRVSQPVIMDANLVRPRHLWRYGIQGKGHTLLHDRGIYDVEHVLFNFCDMLSLVALPATMDLTQQVYTLPKPQDPKKIAAQPHSTEEQKHRIDISKRVEGEYVNYKEFETGDNIQRIVWKIYAKSGQLVVRIPEIKDPYASHLYFYVSYFHGFNLNDGAFETELLNAYKDHVRNLLEALQRNGYDVRIPQDQEVPKLAGVGEKKIELFQISAANWQASTPPSIFVNAGKAAFVCVPSLTPVAEIEAVLKKLPSAIPLVVVKLSDAIPSPFRFQLKDIFFKPEKHPVDALTGPWLLSSLRRELLKNEKEIEKVLRLRENSWMTSTMAFEEVK